MNDSSSKIALIQSRLPYTDRRALSEAWFSALHLAGDGTPVRAVAARLGASSGVEPSTGGPLAGDARRIAARAQNPVIYARGGSPRSAAACPAEGPRRRAIASPATAPAQKPEASRPSYASFRTCLTIGVEKGRVQLLLRREGGTLHVVALCRPQAVETVRRALSLAGAQLRTQGEAVRSSVRAFEGTTVRS